MFIFTVLYKGLGTTHDGFASEPHVTAARHVLVDDSRLTDTVDVARAMCIVRTVLDYRLRPTPAAGNCIPKRVAVRLSTSVL